MSFTPVIPLGGYGGWLYLQRTMASQKAAFARQGTIQRDEEYFRNHIGTINSAAELVADRRLLRVALGAFGLEGDIDNRFFIRKVLEGGTLRPDALALRLADKRYRDFSAAFGFGDYDQPRTRMSDFPDRILTAWQDQQFEAAIGNRDENMRLAMNARREIARIASADSGADARWFTLMGQAPLRRVVETAFGLPTAFGALDIDRQKDMLDDKVQALFGSRGLEQFADPDRLEALIKRFLLRADTTAGSIGSQSASIALALLQNAVMPSPGR